MDILFNKEVNTRKLHECHGCLEVFPENTSMNRQVNVDGGRNISQIYTCLICQQLLDDFPEMFVDDNEFYRGCVYNTLGDCMESTPEQLLHSLMQENKRK